MKTKPRNSSANAAKPLLLTTLLALALFLGFEAVKPKAILGAQATMTANGTIAPHVTLNVLGNLDFGELLISNGVPGYYDLDPGSGTATASNAVQIGTTGRGSFSITGRSGTNIVLTIADAGFVCDTSYIGTCTGTPTLELRNTFTSGTTGQISTTSCTGVKCTDTVYVGGRFVFTGSEEGRWTNTLTITANYQ